MPYPDHWKIWNYPAYWTERYKLYVNELEHIFEEKDLGVHIDSELKFEENISNKVNKANSLVGIIRRTFSHLGVGHF